MKGIIMGIGLISTVILVICIDIWLINVLIDIWQTGGPMHFGLLGKLFGTSLIGIILSLEGMFVISIKEER